MCLRAELKPQNCGKKDSQMCNKDALSIVKFLLSVFFILLILSFSAPNWLQMLPNGLGLLDVSIVVDVDEAQLHHDLSHGHFTDSSLERAFELEQDFLQVLFESLQEQI